MRVSNVLGLSRLLPSRTKTILLGVVVFGLAMIGVKPATGQRSQVPVIVGIPEDWSHHHVVFSQPRTAEEAVRLQQEPRYWHQWFRRNVLRQLPAQPVSGPAPSPAPGPAPGPAYVSAEDFPPITLPELKRGGNRGARSVSLHGLWEKQMGPSASSTGTAAVYPAKFQFLTATNTALADCSKDFIVFPTGVAGATTTVASIVAYNNIYTGCGGTVPLTAWAVNLNAGTVVTSPVLSQDGTQVAFVATFGGVANLVVLTWKNAAGIAQITASSATVNNGCATPCAAWVSLGTTDGVAVTGGFVGSSPFYDYANNIVYVGDHAGKLHKITNVFAHYGSNITPIANINPPAIDPSGSGFPATVSTAQLTSPVYDSEGGYIWVADQTGFISAVRASSGAVTKSTDEYAHGDFFTDGPLIDSSAEFGYFFSPKDENDCGGSPYCAAVIQVKLTTAGFPTTKLESAFAKIGVDTTVSTDTPVYAGAFDSTYYGGSGGNLYACGDPYGVPTLYQIPISATNTFGTVTAGPKPSSTSQAACSPIAEVLNGATDYIFVSVTGTGSDTGCATAGCIYSYNVSGPITAANFATLKATAGLAVTGGTGGIVIDNTYPTSSIPTNGSSAGGTSQVYFSNLTSQTCTTDSAAGGCAIQASQSAFK